MTKEYTIKEKEVGYIDTEKNKVVYPFLKKEYKATPEEKVRLLMVKKLIFEYKYKPKQIDIEISIPSGQTVIPKRADIVVFKDEKIKRPDTHAYIIIEVKSGQRKDGISQLDTYVNNTTAEYGVWFNGNEIAYLHRSREPHEFIDILDIPKLGETLETIGLFTKKDLIAATELQTVFNTIHNHIYANEGFLKAKVFDEMLKLIFVKMVDEKTINPKCEFRITEKEREEISEGKENDFLNRINNLFERVKREYKDVFSENEKNNLTGNTLAFVVSQLQKYSLRNTPSDVKGVAFQTFVYAHQRGDRGEFFTPHPVVQLMIKMMDPSDGELILDPACGSAGFLVEAMRYVWDKFKKADPSTKAVDLVKYAHTYIKGIDFNPDLAKVEKMHMVLYDDGHTGIFSTNSLERINFIKKKARESMVSDIDFGKFDIILTNPPFGSKGKIENKQILEQFDLGYKWKLNKETGKYEKTDNLVSGQVPDILFVERCLDFLREGGRMGVVLPDGDLTNQNTRHLRQYILSRAKVLSVVSLPPETFVPHGAGVKTSVLFLQKLKKQEMANIENEKYPVFMAIMENIGYDIRGRTIFKKDENGNKIKNVKGEYIIETDYKEIVEAFRTFRYKNKIKFNKMEIL